MFLVQLIVHWLHIFFALFWFGGTLFMFAVVTPALENSGPAAAAEVGNHIGLRMTRTLAPVGGLAILFGLLNATLFGPVKSLEFIWSSTYGVTFAIAVVLAIGLAVLGTRTGRVGMSIAGSSETDRPRLLNQVRRMAGMSVLGFVAVLICMVLMRYGL